MLKEAKAVGDRREKHWSPNTLTNADPISPGPQHLSSQDNSQAFSWTMCWLQVWIRGTPAPGSIPMRKENLGTKEFRVKEKRCYGPFLSQVPKWKAEDSMDLEALALLQRKRGCTGSPRCTCMGMKGKRGTGCKKISTDLNRQWKYTYEGVEWSKYCRDLKTGLQVIVKWPSC